MLKDVTLLIIAAAIGTGTGLAAMAAPLYFTNTPRWIWGYVIWLSVAVIATALGDCVALLFYKQLRHGTLALASISAFFAAWAVTHQTSKFNKTPGSEASKPKGSDPLPISALPLPSIKKAVTGIRLHGGSNITLSDNYFGSGVDTAIDAENVQGLAASGNVHEPMPSIEKIPDRLQKFNKISNAQLVIQVNNFANKMRLYEDSYNKKENEQQEADRSNLMRSPEDQEQKTRNWKNMTEKNLMRMKDHSARFRKELYPEADEYFNELRSRLFYSQASGSPALDHGMLAGVNPISKAASVLESMAARLPLPK